MDAFRANAKEVEPSLVANALIAIVGRSQSVYLSNVFEIEVKSRFGQETALSLKCRDMNEISLLLTAMIF